MAWDMLRRLLKLLGGKFVSKMAPRLLFFQYYDRIALEIEEKKKKFRIAFHQSPADHALRHLLTRSQLFKSGMSTVLEDSQEDVDAVSVLELHGHEDFWDDRTISSHYEEQAGWDYDIVEL
jgi:hypothetical protein